MSDELEGRIQTGGDALAPGTTLCHGQYTIVNYLNSGGFGVTYLTLDSLGRKVVIKECFPGAMCCRSGESVGLRSRNFETDFDRVVELFEKEARALAHLQHPHIVGVHQIFKDNGTAYMALDFVEGPDLLYLHETKPELLGPPELGRLLTQLLEALVYVHANGILHRDIAPDNILLGPDNNPVLIDFGAARDGATRASRVLSRVHTVKDGYSPQEFYLAGSAQERSSDLYSLAATFHHLIVGFPPPNSNVRLAAVAEHNPDPYQPLRGRVQGYDEHFLAALDQCLSLFTRDRLESAEEWLDRIDDTRRKAKFREAVKLDEAIEKKISALVLENKKALQADQATRRKMKKRLPERRDPEPDKRAKEREYWAILNEDPRSWPKEKVVEPKSVAAFVVKNRFIADRTEEKPVKVKPPVKEEVRKPRFGGLFGWGRKSSDGDVANP